MGDTTSSQPVNGIRSPRQPATLSGEMSRGPSADEIPTILRLIAAGLVYLPVRYVADTYLQVGPATGLILALLAGAVFFGLLGFVSRSTSDK